MPFVVAFAKPLRHVCFTADLKPLDCRNTREALVSDREDVDICMMLACLQWKMMRASKA
jgi:hypothetical protein